MKAVYHSCSCSKSKNGMITSIKITKTKTRGIKPKPQMLGRMVRVRWDPVLPLKEPANPWWKGSKVKLKSESVSHSVISDFLWIMDCSLPSSSVRGILQARILQWTAIPSPGDFPASGPNPGLLHCRRFITIWVTRPGKPYYTSKCVSNQRHDLILKASLVVHRWYWTT